MGIGENGHIAFNDPPVADFNDKEKVKIVELDIECRQQQVNDGCFHTCLLYTSDAADERSSVDLGGRRIIKKQKNKKIYE